MIKSDDGLSSLLIISVLLKLKFVTKHASESAHCNAFYSLILTVPVDVIYKSKSHSTYLNFPSLICRKTEN